MNTAHEAGVVIEQARTFLADYCDTDPSIVEPVGEGAWSRCFGFSRGDEAFVIRFGNHVDDFEKDRRAYAFDAPDLPIPEVVDIGRAFDGYYAISRRVHGVPLESLNAQDWFAIVPSVVSALEAMRAADLTGTDGVGGWGRDGNAHTADWSEHLLAVAHDTPDRRTHGWHGRLASSPQDDATFAWGFDLLQNVVDDSVPRCLVHADLINRNVLVDSASITGVFDWGCSIYGDHLYDLAWFEFWSPWYPKLDFGHLRSELERQWRVVGYAPQNKQARLAACYLHIGLDHLAYNAYLGDWPTLSATAKRMRILVSETGIGRI